LHCAFHLRCCAHSTLCFVCSHLAAHRGNVTGRNADFNTIVDKVAFDGEADVEWEFRGLENTKYGKLHMSGGRGMELHERPTFGIMDHDLVVWLGDLNYRIAESVPTDEVGCRLQCIRMYASQVFAVLEI
jgi:inositol polyphosphate 5-phosphatase INPP5B/F